MVYCAQKNMILGVNMKIYSLQMTSQESGMQTETVADMEESIP